MNAVRPSKKAATIFAAVLTFATLAIQQPVSAQALPQAPALTFTFSPVNVAGAQALAIYAVNNSGNMVGTYLDSAGSWHGLVITAGKAKTIDHPGAANGTFIYGINSKGVLAGFYQDAIGGSYGFTYSGGKFTAVTPSAGAPTQVYGLNDKGQVTGSFFDLGLNKRRAFFGTAAGYTVLDAPNSISTLAWGINNAGIVTLVWQNTAGLRNGAIYTNKKFTTVNVPGATETLMRGINTAGDLALSYVDATGSHSALRTGGKFYKFSDPVMPNGTRVTGINDKRTMAGNLLDSSGNFTANGFKVTY